MKTWVEVLVVMCEGSMHRKTESDRNICYLLTENIINSGSKDNPLVTPKVGSFVCKIHARRIGSDV